MCTVQWKIFGDFILGHELGPRNFVKTLFNQFVLNLICPKAKQLRKVMGSNFLQMMKYELVPLKSYKFFLDLDVLTKDLAFDYV